MQGFHPCHRGSSPLGVTILPSCLPPVHLALFLIIQQTVYFLTHTLRMRPFPVEFPASGTSPETGEPSVRLFGYIEVFFCRNQQPVAAERASKRQCVSFQIEHGIETSDLFLGIFAPEHDDTLRRSFLKPPVTGKPYPSETAPTYQLVVGDIVSVYRIETEQSEIFGHPGKVHVTDESGPLIPSDTKSLHLHRRTL